MTHLPSSFALGFEELQPGAAAWSCQSDAKVGHGEPSLFRKSNDQNRKLGKQLSEHQQNAERFYEMNSNKSSWRSADDG